MITKNVTLVQFVLWREADKVGRRSHKSSSPLASKELLRCVIVQVVLFSCERVVIAIYPASM